MSNKRVRPWVKVAVLLFWIGLFVCVAGGIGYWAYGQGHLDGVLGKQQPAPAPVVPPAEPVVPATSVPAAPVQPTISVEKPTPSIKLEKPKPTATPVEVAPPKPPEVEEVTPPEEELPEFTVVIANFPSYYNVAWMKQGGFDTKWGFRLTIIPMESGPDCAYHAYSEDEQAELLRSGQIDCLFTTHDTFRQGAYGQVILGTDMSRGADLVAAYKPGLTFNDMIGKPIAVALNSVSEFFTIILYRIIGADPADPTVRITVADVETAEEALEAYRAGEASAVAAWVPVIYEGDDGKIFADVEVEVSPGKTEIQSIQVGYKVIDSARIPAILDVAIVSNQAVEQRPEVVQAFTNAWFDALSQMFANPEKAAEAIIQWDQANYEWTGLEAYAADMGYTPGEALADYMWGIAQAGFWPNVVLMQDHTEYAARGEQGILAKQIAYALDIWRSGGVSVATVNPIKVVNPTFVLEAYRKHPKLMGSAQPLFTDYPFVLHGDDPLKHVFTEGDIDVMDIIASLPKLAFEFITDTGTLKPEYEATFKDYMVNKVRPAMEATSSDVGLVCTVGAAWPETYTREQILAFLKGTRIKDISQLMGGTYMVDMTRVVFNPWMPDKRGDVKDEYRFVQCELGALGGR